MPLTIVNSGNPKKLQLCIHFSRILLPESTRPTKRVSMLCGKVHPLFSSPAVGGAPRPHRAVKRRLLLGTAGGLVPSGHFILYFFSGRKSPENKDFFQKNRTSEINGAARWQKNKEGGGGTGFFKIIRKLFSIHPK